MFHFAISELSLGPPKSQDYILRILDFISSQSRKIESQSQKIETQSQKIETQAKEIKQLRNDLNEKPNEEKYSKRLVYPGIDDVLSMVMSLQNEISKLKAGLPKASAGSVYVRWGRNSCPNVNGTELIYSGYAGGSWYGDSGAAANYICLPTNPDWDHYSDAHDAGATVYGAEYQLGDHGIGTQNAAQFVGGNLLHQEDVPCSVCRSSRPTSVMIPGKNQCLKGWTMEYHGYLSSGPLNEAAASEFVCLDSRPEVLQGGHTNQNGKLFQFVEGRCGSLPCPPYFDGRELTCVVCTK